MLRTLPAIGLFLLLLLPSSALAAGSGSMELTVVGNGTVTGTGINCPGACSHSRTWSTQLPPTNRLTATPGPGLSVTWEGCTPVQGHPNLCDAGYGDDVVGETQIRATFSDKTAPALTLGGPAENERFGGTKKAGFDYTTTVTEAVGMGSVAFSLAGPGGTVQWVDRDAPFGGRVDLIDRPSGTYTLTARPTDAAGNVGAEATRSFVVDNTKPPLAITGGVAEDALRGPGQATLDFSTAVEEGGSLKCAFYKEPSFPGAGTYTSCTDTNRATGMPDSDGQWSFVVRVADDLENVSTVKRTFRFDGTPPQVTVQKSAGQYVRQGTATSITPVWTDASAVTTIDCSGPGQPRMSCGDVVKQDPNTTEGEHLWEYLLVDEAGNEARATAKWIVDGSAPTLAITGGPAEGATVPAGAIAFTLDAKDARSAVRSLTCSWDGGAFGACDARTLAAGTHKFTARAEDEVGLVTTVARSFTVSAPATGDGGPNPGTGDDGPHQRGDTGKPPATQPALTVLSKKLKKALKSGLKVRVTGATAGAVLRFTVKRAGKAVASGRATVPANGTATATLTFTKAAKRALAKARSATLTISAGGVSATTKVTK